MLTKGARDSDVPLHNVKHEVVMLVFCCITAWQHLNA